MNFNLLATSAWRRESVVKPARPPESSGQQTVFIIEDNPESLRVMRQALAAETCRVETACSAEAALRRLSAAPPALILLNTRVLAADGTPLFRGLLMDARLVSVPIVALTESGTGMVSNPESAGRFDGHIGMPIDDRTFPGEVRACLDALTQASAIRYADLRLPSPATGDRWRDAADLLDAIEVGLPDSQFCAATGPELQRLAEAVKAFQHLEVASSLRQAERLSNAATVRARRRFRSLIHHCRELVDLSPEATPGFAELRTVYLDRRLAELKSLEQSLKNRDFAALGKAGHNLKGMGAAYGFTELTDIGRALEAAAKNADTTAIEDHLAQIDTYIGIVRPSPE